MLLSQGRWYNGMKFSPSTSRALPLVLISRLEFPHAFYKWKYENANPSVCSVDHFDHSIVCPLDRSLIRSFIRSFFFSFNSKQNRIWRDIHESLLEQKCFRRTDEWKDGQTNERTDQGCFRWGTPSLAESLSRDVKTVRKTFSHRWPTIWRVLVWKVAWSGSSPYRLQCSRDTTPRLT